MTMYIHTKQITFPGIFCTTSAVQESLTNSWDFDHCFIQRGCRNSYVKFGICLFIKVRFIGRTAASHLHDGNSRTPAHCIVEKSSLLCSSARNHSQVLLSSSSVL